VGCVCVVSIFGVDEQNELAESGGHLKTLFLILSRWPLWVLHPLGWLLGWLVCGLSPTYRRRLWANARVAQVPAAAIWNSVGETGKMVAELPRLWLGPSVPVQWAGAEHIERALAQQQGIVFLTPHLGGFEMAGRAYAERFGALQPILALFRPSRQQWLQDIMATARHRPGLETVPTTLSGVRQLVKVLRQGGVVGLLPDQVPPEGQGVMAPFFGQPAYTMTLAVRLAQVSQAQVLLAWCERLSWGRGFVIHVAPASAVWPAEPQAACTAMNAALEQVIRDCPSQYLWAYARYKIPKPIITTEESTPP
jgi:KDO2-lipid IV(A) lauroyltransferase